MKVLKYLSQRIYTTWCCTWFIVPFVVTYPFQVLLLRKQQWHKHVHNINRLWSTIFLRMFITPLQVEWRMKLDPEQRYIFTPNHSSYLDIPMMLRAIPGFLNFVGKSSLAKVPLWGKVYGALYISVDRKSAMSSAKSYIQSKKTLDEGRSLVIFPEGTIAPNAGQELLEFKDGPFKIAIEKQVPVVPVTMPYNQYFMPDVEEVGLRLRRHPLKLIIHEPIETAGMTLEDLPALKDRVFHIIQQELTKHNYTDVNRYSNHQKISTPGQAGV
ncbi:1-acyl-sn-glycerol-3-phosphate acyltransferase [Pontibacter sp. KCTC 32443]|uniref:lysophospholipid acyltransferase family protein n=1 Tax=Pontibacter TaxID=323449 RepID=UPI00164D0CA9|nr:MULTISPECIES: lysophospholipid acyltransferase family protein [Pontibacter]MBC5773842.1 1-acyl-sn-glycerol-3-phosphate acyltransferase [Pontibacter sp. KCTC 32443]